MDKELPPTKVYSSSLKKHWIFRSKLFQFPFSLKKHWIFRSKFFSLRIDPFSEEMQNNFNRLWNPVSVPIPFTDSMNTIESIRGRQRTC